jgi:UDP-N-acetylmuramate: L-alanyl-gamma-D-glutamyl-meso-diaminopimelate ligase
VVEGDEYHTAFYAKKPKFFFYRPEIVVINAIEFDHADIYADVDAIRKEFRELLCMLPAAGCAVCCVDYPQVLKLIEEVRDDISCRLVTFGSLDGMNANLQAGQGMTLDTVDYLLTSRRPLDSLSTGYTGSSSGTMYPGQRISVDVQCLRAAGWKGGHSFSIELPLIGHYNGLNALAAVIALKEAGVPFDDILKVMPVVGGAGKRQQVLFSDSRYVLIEDFAHHPTAVAGTVQAVREVFPDKRLIAVFEPRSNTSRRKIFQKSYASAFNGADVVVISDVTSNSRMNTDVEMINVEELVEDIKTTAVTAVALPGSESVYEWLVSRIRPGDVVLVMANGAFGNISSRLADFLRLS